MVVSLDAAVLLACSVVTTSFCDSAHSLGVTIFRSPAPSSEELFSDSSHIIADHMLLAKFPMAIGSSLSVMEKVKE
jgi:hypothetical protein